MLLAVAGALFAVLTMAHRTVDAADAPPSSFYVLKGDYSEIASKGTIRFLVHGESDYLPRAGDPRAAERELAEQLAHRLGVNAVFSSVAEQASLISQSHEAHGT